MSREPAPAVERVAVKICGVCSAADAALATAAGADYVGVILAPGRTRSRTLSEAAEVLAGAGALRVGVFVDPGVAEVLRAVERLRLDIVQLHGTEPPALLEELAAAGVVAWKAVPVRTAEDVARAAPRYARVAGGLLLDGWSPAGAGGTGTAFDWHAIAAARAALPDGTALVVAGGLHAGNVGVAVAVLRPDVVDVSSGVEEAPGRKSAQRVRAFIAAARAAVQ